MCNKHYQGLQRVILIEKSHGAAYVLVGLSRKELLRDEQAPLVMTWHSDLGSKGDEELHFCYFFAKFIFCEDLA